VAGNGSATVSFTAPASDGGAPITSFTVRASSGQTATTTTLSAVVTGLAKGVPVTFTVTAVNSGGSAIGAFESGHADGGGAHSVYVYPGRRRLRSGNSAGPELRNRDSATPPDHDRWPHHEVVPEVQRCRLGQPDHVSHPPAVYH
jgi:hypothetical protein